MTISTFTAWNTTVLRNTFENEFQASLMLTERTCHYVDMGGTNAVVIPIGKNLTGGIVTAGTDRVGGANVTNPAGTLTVGTSYEVNEEIPDEILKKNGFDVINRITIPAVARALAQGLSYMFVNQIVASVSTSSPDNTITGSISVTSGVPEDGMASEMLKIVNRAALNLDAQNAPFGPDERWMALYPAHYYALAQNEQVMRKDWGGMADVKRFGDGYLEYQGFQIIKTNAVSQTDFSDNTTYDTKYRTNNSAINSAGKLYGVYWARRGVAVGAQSTGGTPTTPGRVTQVETPRHPTRFSTLVHAAWLGDMTYLQRTTTPKGTLIGTIADDGA